MVHSCKSSHNAILSHVGFGSGRRRLPRNQTRERGLEVRHLSIKRGSGRGARCVYIVPGLEELSLSSGPVRVTNQQLAN